MPRIIALANQKGGVGKTTSAINISAGLTKFKQKVLLIDIDSQGNATSGLGISKKYLNKTMLDVFMEESSLPEVILKTATENLDVAPSNMDLVGTESMLADKENHFTRLKKALNFDLFPILNDYNYIIIDCPPSLGFLTLNGLLAASGVIVPVQCEFYALEGLADLLKTIDIIRLKYNPTLVIEGIILTMFDSRTNLSREVEKELRGHYPDKVFKSVIPRSIRFGEAPSYGEPILTYDRASLGAQAYFDLAWEVHCGET
jgi:chromosome partitioning protein